MINYSNFSRDLREEISKFFNDVIYPYFDKPRKKVILDLFYGILKTGSTKISEISRTVDLNKNIGSIENRLTIGLKEYDLSNIQNGIINYAYSSILKYPIEIEIDETDIIKPYGKSFEDLNYIHDGSKEGRPKEKGYPLTGIIGIGLNNSIIPLSLNLYSTITKGFKSTNQKTINDLDNLLSKCISLNGITITFDRGYDNKEYINYCEFLNIDYVIRAKIQRKYTTNKGNESIEDIDKRLKGKYSFKFKNKNDKEVETKVSAIKIKHKDFIKDAYLVFESFPYERNKRFYITSIDCSTKDGCIKALKSYRKRWRIEEYFRFIKQEFNLEGFRIREIKAINNLIYIVNLCVLFLTKLSVTKSKTYYNSLNVYKSFNDKEYENNLIKRYGENGLMLYRIKRGIQEILHHSILKVEVPGRVRKKKEMKQLSIFEINN